MSKGYTNSDLPINPTRVEIDGDDTWYAMGLTKREHFAAIAMQGSLSGDIEDNLTIEDIAIQSRQMADALLEELEK